VILKLAKTGKNWQKLAKTGKTGKTGKNWQKEDVIRRE